MTRFILFVCLLICLCGQANAQGVQVTKFNLRNTPAIGTYEGAAFNEGLASGLHHVMDFGMNASSSGTSSEKLR